MYIRPKYKLHVYAYMLKKNRVGKFFFANFVLSMFFQLGKSWPIYIYEPVYDKRGLMT